MSLTAEDVYKIARLARLAIEPDQADHYARELSVILDFVAELEQADTAQVMPMAHPLHMAQRLRADVVVETNQHEKFQTVAPMVEAGLYLVPKVIE